MIYAMNYADGEPYSSYQKTNSWTAKKIGKIDDIFEYSSSDIPYEYREKFKSIFSQQRGAGLWLWKPYLFYHTLLKLKENDWLVYTDSGSFYIRKIKWLIDCAEKNGQSVMLMEQPLLCRQFTKRECYVLTGIEDKDENQVLGLLLAKKCNESLSFIKEWLELCEREDLLSPSHFHPEVAEFSDFYAHREDQSLLSLLRIKHGLPVFRDCSDYGEFPFAYASSKYTYHPRNYYNSDYPTIILCNRKVHPFLYWFKYVIKHFLNSFFPVLFRKRYLD